MNVIRCKDWYVGIEKIIEKEDVTVCKSLSKVAVKVFFFFVINTGRCVDFHKLLNNYCVIQIIDRHRTDKGISWLCICQ